MKKLSAASCAVALVGLVTVAHAQPAKSRVTGIVCNEGYASGNRLTYLEIDSHEAFAAGVTLGGIDAAIVKKFFPEIAATPSSTRVSLALPINACTYDENARAVVSCSAASGTASVATLTYYKNPDEITIRRSISTTNIKLEVTKEEGDKLALTISFAATSRGRKINYAFKKAFGSLKPRLETNAVARPTEGCALAAGVRVAEAP